MADWTDLTSATAYTAVLNALLDRTKALSKMALTAETSLPTGAITAVPDDGKFQKWSGTAWADWQFKAAALATDAVETAKIKDLNVTTGKLAADAVTTAKFCGVNNAYLRWKDTGAADVSVLGLDSSDDTVLNCKSAKYAYISTNGTKRWGVKDDAATVYAWLPAGDNTQDLGGGSNQVRYLFIGSGVRWPTATVSLTGTNQSGAASLAVGFNYVNTSASNYCGKLPAGLRGMWAFVYSDKDNSNFPLIYPATNEYMNEVQNASKLLGSGSMLTFYCYANGYWCSEA